MMPVIKTDKRKLHGFTARLRKLQDQADDLTAAELDDDVFERRNSQWTARWEKLRDELMDWYGHDIAPQRESLDELTDTMVWEERIEDVLTRLGDVGPIAPGPPWDADADTIEDAPETDAGVEDVADGVLTALADDLEQLLAPIELTPEHRQALADYATALEERASLIREVLKVG